MSFLNITNKAFVLQINKDIDELFGLLKEFERYPADDSVKSIYKVKINNDKQLTILLYFGYDSRNEIWVEVIGNILRLDNGLFIQFIPKLGGQFIEDLVKTSIIGIIFIMISIKVYPILLLLTIPAFLLLISNVFSDINEQWILIKRRLVEMIVNIG